MSSFKQLPLSDLRESLPKFKRQVQLGMKRIAATYYGQVVGFLVPLKDLEKALEENAINKSEEMSLSDFRLHLTECWERLQVDVDCIYVTYHTRRAVAFVSPRLIAYLAIPVSEVADKLLIIDSGLVEVTSLNQEK
ncbi:prevent-host-death family protein [Anabaena azotica]|nr:prevent-host-death family protein [Anabaena azotica]